MWILFGQQIKGKKGEPLVGARSGDRLEIDTRLTLLTAVLGDILAEIR